MKYKFHSDISLVIIIESKHDEEKIIELSKQSGFKVEQNLLENDPLILMLDLRRHYADGTCDDDHYLHHTTPSYAGLCVAYNHTINSKELIKGLTQYINQKDEQ